MQISVVDVLLFTNWINWDLLRFNESNFASNHLFICLKTTLISFCSLVVFGCVINVPVASAKGTVVLYAFFWVMPRHLNFICWRFATLCLFHLRRQVGMKKFFILTCLWRWNGWSVPKHQHIKSRCWGITQKKAYTIQNMAKVWNQGSSSFTFYNLR